MPSGKALATSVSSRTLLAPKPSGLQLSTCPSLSAPKWDTGIAGVLGAPRLLFERLLPERLLPAGLSSARQMPFQIAE